MATMQMPILDDTMGAAFIGMVIATCLHGVSCAQAWFYFTHQNDRWPIKLLVSSVMLFDTVHEVLIAHAVYMYTISHWGQNAELNKIVWSLILQVTFNGLTALFVQSFLAMRVWWLSNRCIILTFPVVLLVVGEFVCIILFTIQALQFKTMMQLFDVKPLCITINILAAAGDILIATSLCTMLHLSRTGFKRSEIMINTLILFCVSTGLLTSLCALATLIALIVAENTLIYIAFYFSLGSLYTNCLLATLNAREKVRRSGQDIQLTSQNFSNLFHVLPITRTRSSMNREDIPSKIDTT